jgi:hypothetical protein
VTRTAIADGGTRSGGLGSQTFCITVCPNIIDDQDDPFMKYVIDLDPVHQVLRVTVIGTLTDSAARELHASLSHFATASVPYAAIFDLSRVTDNQLSIETIRDLVKKRPAVPTVRLRVVVAPRPVDYGMSRMFERDEMRGQFHLVLSVAEAYAMLGVSTENFSQRLFPEQFAA